MADRQRAVPARPQGLLLPSVIAVPAAASRAIRSIEKLNEAWGLNLWSQAYSSFAEIPMPKSTIWHHPSLIAAWMDFQSDSYVEFCGMQADIIHELTIHPVGTDIMPTGGVNYAKIHEKLDMVQFNHYCRQSD